MIEIVTSGLLTTVQDLGRPGYAHIGVSHSGAVDPALARHCNLLVGNPPDAALIETVGGLTIRATAPVTIASDVEPTARTLHAGDEMVVPLGERGWHYVAVRGGIETEPVLGSRSTDTLGGVGHPPLGNGDVLPIGPEPSGSVVGEVSPARPSVREARIYPGPRRDWFVPEAWNTLTAGPWVVGEASRVGVRLLGGRIERLRHDELPSEGLIRGAMQVPASGEPIMMLSDHPTTGGYPVIAVVHPDDVANVAQTSVGDTIRLRPV